MCFTVAKAIDVLASPISYLPWYLFPDGFAGNFLISFQPCSWKRTFVCFMVMNFCFLFLAALCVGRVSRVK